MKTSQFSKERGQSIVIVALMMVAFLAILALSIDGGLTYAQRRRAQNAADAGALAGARAMCTPGGGNPFTAAREFASRNGITDVNSNVNVSTSQVDLVSSVVVTVTIPYDTFFAGVIGIANAQVGAVAEAACYPPCSAGGVLPIAWSCAPPDVGGGSISDTCDVFAQDSDGCQYGDDPIYIVADSASISDDIVCQDPGEPVNPAYVDCDINNDGVNDLNILSGANRSWLDLNGGSSDANELKDWVRGINVPPVREHTWFAGKTGVVDTVYKAVADYRLNQDVIIPVFDRFDTIKNGGTPSPFHGNDLFMNSGAGDYFHVMTFAIFHVTCVSANKSDLCPAKQFLVDNKGLKDNTKTIEGCFKKGLFEGGGHPGECNVDAGAFVLKLIR